MASIAPIAPQQYFDNSGNPLNGGKVHTYEAGTTTPKLTWSDINETVPNANPVILDSAGRANIFWRGIYNVEVRTSADVLVTTFNNYNTDNAFNGILSTFTPTDASGAGLIFTPSGGRAIKIGRLVHFQLNVFYPVNASAAAAVIGGLPYVSVNSMTRASLAVGFRSTGLLPTSALVAQNAQTILLFNGGAPATNTSLSSVDMYLSGTYETAS